MESNRSDHDTVVLGECESVAKHADLLRGIAAMLPAVLLRTWNLSGMCTKADLKGLNFSSYHLQLMSGRFHTPPFDKKRAHHWREPTNLHFLKTCSYSGGTSCADCKFNRRRAHCRFMNAVASSKQYSQVESSTTTQSSTLQAVIIVRSRY